MIFAYMKFAFRNLLKQGFRSFINILGLGFGIACCILIYMYSKHELSYNRFHENKDRIYRVYGSYIEAKGDKSFTPYFNYELARGIYDEIPGVEKSCGLRSMRAWIGNGDQLFEERIGFADSSFLEMLSFPVIVGDPNSPLNEPQSVILTETVAMKIFGDSIENLGDIIGESIGFPQSPPNQFIVTGIIADPPANNSFSFSVLVPYANAQYYPQCNNSFGNSSIYIMLDQENDKIRVEENLKKLEEKYYGEILEQGIHFGYLADVEDNFNYHLQSLNDLYLDSDELRGCYERTGNIRIIYILSSIAALILLIACFNYVMLSIGYSMNRIKDLGMMNVTGAFKSQILGHFIMESFLLTLLALFLGIILAEQLLPVFNRIADESLTFTLYGDWRNYLFLAALLFAIVISTSIYTGWFLLRKNQPIRYLRKELLSMKRHQFARFFVILQYLITITLLICSGLIVKQLQFMLEKDVGFERNNLVVLPVDFPLTKVLTLKENLLQHPQIQSVSMSDRNFVSGSSSTDIKNHKGELVSTRFLRIDTDYIETFKLDLIDGRNFTGTKPVDENFNVIVNEAFVRHFDLEFPVGEVINIESFEVEVTIIGVVGDFHFDSMHGEIMPVMMIVFPFNSIWNVFVRIDPQDIQTSLEIIEQTWMDLVPEFSYDYSFLTDMLDEQYRSEDRWSKITAISSLIAILLSCLGLLGISGLLVVRRIKEIGIRKATGSTVLQVILLLNKDILKWVAVAFVLACPAAWFIGKRWLQDFAFRTEISWWLFILAGVITVLISLLTISWQTYRAARQNPVNALRYE